MFRVERSRKFVFYESIHESFSFTTDEYQSDIQNNTFLVKLFLLFSYREEVLLTYFLTILYFSTLYYSVSNHSMFTFKFLFFWLQFNEVIFNKNIILFPNKLVSNFRDIESNRLTWFGLIFRWKFVLQIIKFASFSKMCSLFHGYVAY